METTASKGSLYGGWLTKYQHVERLGSEECEGLLDGEVIVQEKIDGANCTAAWDHEVGLILASRNQVVSVNGDPKKGFNGFVEYVLGRDAEFGFVCRYPHLILRGEWLVKHTLRYADEHMNKFYVFDVQYRDGGYMPYEEYAPMLDEFGILTVPHIATLQRPTPEELTDLVIGPSGMGDIEREGIVVKRYDFVNRYGRAAWGKLVSKDFKVQHAAVMGYQRRQDYEYLEMKFAHEAVTQAEVLKTIAKIKNEKQPGDLAFSIRDMPQILGRVYHDAFTDHLWDFVKKNKPRKWNFRLARKYVETRTRDIALDYFNGVLKEEE